MKNDPVEKILNDFIKIFKHQDRVICYTYHTKNFSVTLFNYQFILWKKFGKKKTLTNVGTFGNADDFKTLVELIKERCISQHFIDDLTNFMVKII